MLRSEFAALEAAPIPDSSVFAVIIDNKSGLVDEGNLVSAIGLLPVASPE